MNTLAQVYLIVVRLIPVTLGWMPVALVSVAAATDSLYFPNDDWSWKSIDPETVGWDKAKLESALALAGERNSSGVLILHKGRILAEKYWKHENPPLIYKAVARGADDAGHPIEDVASVQKGVTAVLIGIAQEKKLLSIDDSVSKYLGTGWSNTTEPQESAITIRHLMTMTSGLATDLSFEANVGTKWKYNTPAYHLLVPIIEKAAGTDRHGLTQQWITRPLGMTNSRWVGRRGGQNARYGFATTARDLSRFGLMVQAGGRWKQKTIIGDQEFLREMLSSSQDLNLAYGYLWWLNGHDYVTPGLGGRQRSRGDLIPAAPKDLVAMQGAMDRKMYFVPSLDLVVTRLGAAGRKSGKNFNHHFWEALIQAAPEH